MKKYVFLLVLALFAWTAKAQQDGGPVIKWEHATYDFGDITQGDKVEHVFKFTNAGKEPLIITNTRVTCGCTTPNYARDPVPPGGQGEVTVVFNSAGKMGMQNKTVTLVSNAVDNNKISFTANVLAKKAEEPQ